MKRVAIRTKGNHSQGMGDVTGSIALARELGRSGCEVLLIIDEDREAAEAVGSVGLSFSVIKGGREEDLWRTVGKVDVAVVNQLNSSWELLSMIRRYAPRLVTIDDVGEPSRRLADLRINPLYYNHGALSDFGFVPINEVFREARPKAKPMGRQVDRVLVTLGGSDTYGFTPKVVDYLGGIESTVEVTVLLGSAFRCFAELQEVLGKSPRRFIVLGPVDADGMALLLAASDMVICSGGNTMFEAACLGRPALVVCAEPFEMETASRLMEAGIVVNLGFGGTLERGPFVKNTEGLMKDFRARAEMSQKGYERVDGRGAERLCREIIFS